VYVNHTTKEAAWAPPPAWAPWELLRQPVDAGRHLVMPQLLLAYKDLFRVSGDKSAELYTGSPAMHSAQLDLLLVRPPAFWQLRLQTLFAPSGQPRVAARDASIAARVQCLFWGFGCQGRGAPDGEPRHAPRACSYMLYWLCCLSMHSPHFASTSHSLMHTVQLGLLLCCSMLTNSVDGDKSSPGMASTVTLSAQFDLLLVRSSGLRVHGCVLHSRAVHSQWC
jgi:hypothetical protein